MHDQHKCLKNMEAWKNSGSIYKVNKIKPINNISKEKLEPGAKVENWVLVVCCGRDTVQKVVVLPSCWKWDFFEHGNVSFKVYWFHFTDPSDNC